MILPHETSVRSLHFCAPQCVNGTDMFSLLIKMFFFQSVFRGAPDVVHTQCGYLVTSIGKVLCCHLDLSSRAGHLCRCTCLGLQRAMSKIMHWVPHCILLLIVLHLCEGGVFTQWLWPNCCPPGGGKTQYSPQK